MEGDVGVEMKREKRQRESEKEIESDDSATTAGRRNYCT
jgi:hypothetical protein